MAQTVTSKKPSSANKQSRKWHTDNCPCEGRPQPVSRRLQSRRDAKPADANKMKYHLPGSQNRKK